MHAQLGTGNYMLTNGQGIYVVDPAGTLVSTPVSGIDARYVGQYNGSSIQAVPARSRPEQLYGQPGPLERLAGYGVGSGLHRGHRSDPPGSSATC
ncbi:MAG: hypothetical protein R3F17_07980 [Planctomycetota bacterium]